MSGITPSPLPSKLLLFHKTHDLFTRVKKTSTESQKYTQTTNPI